MYKLDTETLGFHSVPILLQYSEPGSKSVSLYDLWSEPAGRTYDLLCDIADKGVVAFNLAYDWFHIQKFFNIIELLIETKSRDAKPFHHVTHITELEPEARFGSCLKPRHCLDLMLQARKGKYQSTMDRKSVYIRRVPRVIAHALAVELEKRIPLKDIYFAKRKNKTDRHWKVQDIELPDGKIDPDFVNVYLAFAPSSALKALVADALGHKTVKFDELLAPGFPIEYQWAAFAKAVSTKEKKWRVFDEHEKLKGYAWPHHLFDHMSFWQVNARARSYAADDVTYLHELQDFFQADPDDDDSILAAMVASCRWRGYAVDIDRIEEQCVDLRELSEKAPMAPTQVYPYLTEVMSEHEKDFFTEQHKTSTKKEVLEGLKQWTIMREEPEDVSEMSIEDFKTSLTTFDETAERHPVSFRAEKVLKARQSKFALDVFNKIVTAGRFHPAASVIGSLSGRMSGRTEVKGGESSGLNALGIGHTKEVRKCFTFGDRGLVLCGGDFASFEISIAIARYNDKKLYDDVLTCFKCQGVWSLEDFQQDKLECPLCNEPFKACVEKGCEKRGLECDNPEHSYVLEPPLQKFHGLFAQAIFPEMSYFDILATKGSEDDKYDKGKRGGFAKLYGGNYNTLMTRLNISEDIAINAEKNFETRYEGVFKARKSIEEKFCSMTQPGGLGSEVVWKEPASYVESLVGFRRDFELENRVCKVLFELANKPPKEWHEFSQIVRRRDRDQKAFGAVMSALYAAAFNIQAQNLRAAANHEIQSTGSSLCKELQVLLWGIQPVGVHSWEIMTMNIHDEIMAPMKPEHFQRATDIINEFVQNRRSLIPLLRIDWSTELNDWSEK